VPLTSARSRLVAGACLGTLLASACTDGDSTAKRSKTVVIGTAPSAESVIVANMYAGALMNDGYQVVVRKGLGQREIYMPALEKGGADNGVDLMPEYVSSLLEHVNRNAREASGNLDESVTRLRSRLDGVGITALEPSPAANQNAFAVTAATAERLRVRKMSDITPAMASNLTLGAGAECPARPSCQPGLERVYGLRFKTFRVLDSGGPRTLDALSRGDIDIGLVLSSDGAVAARNLVVLEDDRKLQAADNLIPAIRKDIVDDDIRETLDKVSAALTTADLIELNRRASVDKTDPEVLAREWLQEHGFTKK
jgi:osmoprotectant transport system substrate-binding protein